MIKSLKTFLEYLGMEFEEGSEVIGHATRQSKLCIGSFEDEYKERFVGLCEEDDVLAENDWLVHVADKKLWEETMGCYPNDKKDTVLKLRHLEDVHLLVNAKIFTPDRLRAYRHNNLGDNGEELEFYDCILTEEDAVFVFIRQKDYQNDIRASNEGYIFLHKSINKSTDAYAEFNIDFDTKSLEPILPEGFDISVKYKKIAQQNGLISYSQH